MASLLYVQWQVHLFYTLFIIYNILRFRLHSLPFFFLLSACPKILIAEKVVCDPLLIIEIGEFRTMTEQTERPNIVEDFTLDSDEED